MDGTLNDSRSLDNYWLDKSIECMFAISDCQEGIKILNRKIQQSDNNEAHAFSIILRGLREELDYFKNILESCRLNLT